MEEILSQIHLELKSLNQRVGGLETGLQDVRKEVKDVKDGIESIQIQMDTRFEGVHKEMDIRFEGVHREFEVVHKRLDTICAQVAHNTEQEVRLNEVIAKVEAHDTDIKLLKKLVSNQ